MSSLQDSFPDKFEISELQVREIFDNGTVTYLLQIVEEALIYAYNEALKDTKNGQANKFSLI